MLFLCDIPWWLSLVNLPPHLFDNGKNHTLINWISETRCISHYSLFCGLPSSFFALLPCFSIACGALCLCVRSYYQSPQTFLAWLPIHLLNGPLWYHCNVRLLLHSSTGFHLHIGLPGWLLPMICRFYSSSHQCIILSCRGRPISQSWNVGPHFRDNSPLATNGIFSGLLWWLNFEVFVLNGQWYGLHRKPSGKTSMC